MSGKREKKREVTAPTEAGTWRGTWLWATECFHYQVKGQYPDHAKKGQMK